MSNTNVVAYDCVPVHLTPAKSVAEQICHAVDASLGPYEEHSAGSNQDYSAIIASWPVRLLTAAVAAGIRDSSWSPYVAEEETRKKRGKSRPTLQFMSSGAPPTQEELRVFVALAKVMVRPDLATNTLSSKREFMLGEVANELGIHTADSDTLVGISHAIAHMRNFSVIVRGARTWIFGFIETLDRPAEDVLLSSHTVVLSMDGIVYKALKDIVENNR